MSESNGTKYHVFLGQPNAGSIMPCCLSSIAHATKKHQVTLAPSQFGDVQHNFNLLWAVALNTRDWMGITHFAMIHSDIRAGQYWIDTLIEEMDRVGADILTTVIAIKDHKGLTTTGIRYPGLWGARRFTVRECHKLPETFSIADTDELEPDPHKYLAINTGLWVCKFPYGWTDQMPGFTCRHKMGWKEGACVPQFDSEDWIFSEWAGARGLKVYATRKVEAYHQGAFEYGNNSEWGSLETDDQNPRDWAEKPLPRIREEDLTAHLAGLVT